MANGATGILTAGPQGIATPEEARRAWPQWLALAIGMVAATGLRRLAAEPAPATAPAGCAGCACGAGGCGALG